MFRKTHRGGPTTQLGFRHIFVSLGAIYTLFNSAVYSDHASMLTYIWYKRCVFVYRIKEWSVQRDHTTSYLQSIYCWLLVDYYTFLLYFTLLMLSKCDLVFIMCVWSFFMFFLIFSLFLSLVITSFYINIKICAVQYIIRIIDRPRQTVA